MIEYTANRQASKYADGKVGMYIVCVSWFIEQGSLSGFETCRLFWLANIIEQPTAKKPDFSSTSPENSLAC